VDALPHGRRLEAEDLGHLGGRDLLDVAQDERVAGPWSVHSLSMPRRCGA
jgi:hypothetical protein